MGINAESRQEGLSLYQISVSGQNSSDEFCAKHESAALILKKRTSQNNLSVYRRNILFYIIINDLFQDPGIYYFISMRNLSCIVDKKDAIYQEILFLCRKVKLWVAFSGN